MIDLIKNEIKDHNNEIKNEIKDHKNEINNEIRILKNKVEKINIKVLEENADKAIIYSSIAELTGKHLDISLIFGVYK
jgi:F0F1-type ATP synthase membrane subunit b/b'